MRKINIIKALLIIWLKFINVSKSATENVSKSIERLDAKFDKVVGKSATMPTRTRFIFHIDNFVGKQMQKNLLMRGIIVILYKITGRKRIANGKYFMMMSHMNPAIIAILDAPEDAEGRAKLGEKIQLKGAGTLYITIPPVQLSDLTPLIKAMRDAVGPAQVQTAWDNLNLALQEIMGLVQTFMNHNRSVAEVCCVYYGFKVKGKGGKSDQVWGGETGTISGTIDLTFEVGPDRCCYDILLWDPTHAKMLGRAQPTDESTATVPDLISGSLQAVSYNVISHGKLIFESGIIDVRVK